MLDGVLPAVPPPPITSSSFIFSTESSSASVSVPTPPAPTPTGPTPSGGDTTPITPQTNISTPLINLDDFRNDVRFTGIDGTGYSTVILDTGIDRNHTFFGPDANNNGISDRIVYSYDFGDNDADASDVNGHGSNVSSIVASSDTTYRGMAPGANIIHLKVFANSGAGNFSMVERALQWVVANASTYNIVSINMSLGDSGNYNVAKQLYGLSDELAALAAMNVLNIAAAGNDFKTHNSAQGLSYPAADPNVLAVGAVYDRSFGGISYASGASATTTGADRVTPFSQRTGSLYQIFAPGAPITGAGHTGGTVTQHGTSQASPHIAGIAVLAQQLAMQTLGRRLTLAEFRTLLTSTGASIVDGDDENDNVTNTGLTFKRVDVAALGQAILDMAPNGPRARVLDGSLNISDGTGSVALGTAIVGSTLTRTFTVTNSGNQNLVLDEPITVPSGFMLVSSFASTTVAPGDSTTFTIGLDTATAGAKSGTLSFTSNDATDSVFSFSLGGTVSNTLLLDDGATGFATAGAWSATAGGYLNDQRTSAAGNGSNTAIWTFSNLQPGRYRVSATWVTATNRATNASYRIYDGAVTDTLLGTIARNQQGAPNDIVDSGKAFEHLGIVFTTGNTLTVRLTNAANGTVNADALRLELMAPAPEITVADGSTPIVDGVTSLAFGTIITGASTSKTLTITNTGNAGLTLGSLTLPLGFTSSGFSVPSLSAGQSTTIQIDFSAPLPGARSGAISFLTNDADEATFNFTLTGTAANFAAIIDDGETGFATVGTWPNSTTGFRADSKYNAAGTGLDSATWTFTGLDAGRYLVSATWAAATNRASNATYVVTDGAGTPNTLVTKVVNQRVAPASRTVSGAAWSDLGTVTLGAGGGETLAITLTDAANGFLIADAIRIERIEPEEEITLKNGTVVVLDNTGAVAFGATPAGTSVSRTLTVQNVGSDDLVLGNTITVPSGYTVTSGFGSTTLASGATTTFTVRLDASLAAAPGAKNGQISFTTSDFDEATFNFNVTGTVTAFVAIIDDGAAGFSTTGTWTAATGGVQTDYRYTPASAGSASALWTFSGLAAGQYRISASWVAAANRANAAAYTVRDGAGTPNTLASVTRNQRLAPNSRTVNGAAWMDLATVTLASDGGGSLVIELLSTMGGFSIADAIRIEKIA